MSKETKTVYICTHCNSDNVQIKAWVKPVAYCQHINYEFVDECPEELGWCEDEQLHAEVQTAEVRADAKVIGFQVVGEDGMANEGKLHPDITTPSSVYSLSQTKEMLKKSNDSYVNYTWRLLTIWTGDIEKPIQMFKGDPRD